jgi:hypothetical protein
MQRQQRVGFLGLGLAIAVALALPAAAATVAPGHYWTNDRDVPLYGADDDAGPVTATLPRGTELTMTRPVTGEFCQVNGLIHWGYVPCARLSAIPVPAEAAGVDGVPADQRWITGNGVVLRADTTDAAAVLARLSLNRRVRLQAPAAGTWCSVETEQRVRGVVACRFLATRPVDLVALSAPQGWDGKPNPHYDPARLFWLRPGWDRMEAYAQTLVEAHRDAPEGQRWPRDAELERMKAELAKGHHAPAPGPLPRWDALLRGARGATRDVPDAAQVLALWGASFASDDGTDRIAGFVRALQLPAVRPSLFKRDSDVAPPVDAQQLAGRFGIPVRWSTTPRPVATSPDEYFDGLYDMHTRSQALLRPVQRVTLFRDGRVDSASTHARSRETLWRESDGEMCAGYVHGFSHGDSSAAIWNYFDYGDPAYPQQLRAESAQLPGSLYRFHVQVPLPKRLATVSRREQAMDRAATGFVHGTTLIFDLDHDAVPDLLVWEGTGRGPGHMEETTTDDTWYRLVLVNIGGHWKVLGTDQFGYGCGC